MSDISCNDSTESPNSSSYGGPASPTLINTPLEEFPLTQPGVFATRPGQPRLLTPAPIAPVPAGPPTATNHLLALSQMSPWSVWSAIASHDLPANTYRAIINGLVVTSEARTHRFTQDLTAQEADHKKKLDDCDEMIEFMEAHLIRYIETFSWPPDGYIENGRLTTFTIPCGNRLSNPAKWVKKLNDGRVAGYSTQDGPHDLPHVCEIRLRMTGGLKPMLCGLEVSTSASSPIRPNLTAPTASSKAQSLPKTNAEATWNVHNFPSGFRIWQESQPICQPTGTLEGDGRRDRDVTSKGGCDVIDLTNEDSSSDDEEL